MWRGGVARDRGLDAVHGGGRGPDRGGSDEPWLRSLRWGWLITRHNWLGWNLRKSLWSHLRYRSYGSYGSWRCQSARSRKLSDPCQQLWGWQVSGEVRKSCSWMTRPRQRGAAAWFSTRRNEGFRTRETTRSAREGRNVTGEAAELLRQVTPQSQDGCTELGQLWILDAGRVHVLRLQGGFSCCGPCWRLLLGLSAKKRKQKIKYNIKD